MTRLEDRLALRATHRDLLLLNAQDVSLVFGHRTAIESQRQAFLALESGDFHAAPRLVMEGRDGTAAFSYLARSGGRGPVHKLGSVVPRNAARGVPVVSALVIVMDAADGAPYAVLDGNSLTTLRTSAASALAAEVLTVPDPVTLSVIGSGVQARSHALMISRHLAITDVRVWGRNQIAAESLVRDLRQSGLDASRAPSARAAAEAADVLALCTTSATPVIDAVWVRASALVISVGSFSAERCEVGSDLVSRATVVVDDVATALDHAGPIVRAVADRTLAKTAIRSLGQVLARGFERDHRQLVYYNSVGIGIQDSVAAQAIVDDAEASGIGQWISWP